RRRHPRPDRGLRPDGQRRTSRLPHGRRCSPPRNGPAPCGGLAVDDPGRHSPDSAGPAMSESWVACLTPAGQAAIATLGLHDPQAWPALRGLFRTRSGKSLPESPTQGRFWLGRLGTDVADEVVLAVRAPALEVHCHAGREVVRFLMDLFIARGLQPCGW